MKHLLLKAILIEIYYVMQFDCNNIGDAKTYKNRLHIITKNNPGATI